MMSFAGLTLQSSAVARHHASCHEAFFPASSASALITLSIGALGARRGDRRPAVQRDIHLSWANALRCDQSPALSVSKPQVLPNTSRMLLAQVLKLGFLSLVMQLKE